MLINEFNELIQLSNISNILNQIRMILNTSGLHRFSKPQITELKSKLIVLENKFVKQVLDLQLDVLKMEAPKIEAPKVEVMDPESLEKLQKPSIVINEAGTAQPGSDLSSTLTVQTLQIPPVEKVEVEPVEKDKFENKSFENKSKDLKSDPEFLAKLDAAKKAIPAKKKNVKKQPITKSSDQAS